LRRLPRFLRRRQRHHRQVRRACGIANLNAAQPFSAETYPDGRLFEVITNGKGMMSGYGYNIPVRDRWAIVAYVRTLQAAKASSK
jgi:hypothetical protein